MNVHHISLDALIRSVFVLLQEECRKDFLHEICAELDLRPTPLTDRRAWSELLEGQ